jgi:S1-C subfamily serine protease
MAISCGVLVPDDKTNPDGNIFPVKRDSMTVASDGSDMAYLYINNPDDYVKNLRAASFTAGRKTCPTEANLGDPVVILGYPVNGSALGVTVTSGVISGSETNYYVTDAKIDHGSSGGAAIDVNRGCFLGIPTWAAVGDIESFGRILKL